MPARKRTSTGSRKSERVKRTCHSEDEEEINEIGAETSDELNKIFAIDRNDIAQQLTESSVRRNRTGNASANSAVERYKVLGVNDDGDELTIHGTTNDYCSPEDLCLSNGHSFVNKDGITNINVAKYHSNDKEDTCDEIEDSQGDYSSSAESISQDDLKVHTREAVHNAVADDQKEAYYGENYEEDDEEEDEDEEDEDEEDDDDDEEEDEDEDEEDIADLEDNDEINVGIKQELVQYGIQDSDGENEPDEEVIEDEDEDDIEEESVYDPEVVEEIEAFTKSFKEVAKRFKLIGKIGEGTFSSVYKAEDLHYALHDNSWDLDRIPVRKERVLMPSNRAIIGKKELKISKSGKIKKYVAIKRIYVTSSPQRVLNELELLHTLSGCASIAPLITAFRDQDQVVAILPYFRHVDFRDFYRHLPISDIRRYLKSLFTALEHVHAHGILHRDVKPTNFLYNLDKRRGVLVDFGLAERESLEPAYCACRDNKDYEHSRHMADRLPNNGYLKNDSRPGRRANRAGTRGFRAPEVLLKCLNQTTKIDIWSAGVILLSFMSKRFPFFNSADDIDAMIEIATIFGRQKMSNCARLHGAIFDTTLPTILDKAYPLEEIIDWANHRGGEDQPSYRYSQDELLALNFLKKCMETDFRKRFSATEALSHPFLRDIDN
ncbi:kinase-like domain-containing protein [Dipodascopsis uninucleata]